MSAEQSVETVLSGQMEMAASPKESAHIVEAILRQIESAHIRTVKVEFPDFFGVARTKAVPARQFPHVVEHGLQFAFPTFALDLAGNPAPAPDKPALAAPNTPAC